MIKKKDLGIWEWGVCILLFYITYQQKWYFRVWVDEGEGEGLFTHTLTLTLTLKIVPKIDRDKCQFSLMLD